MSARTCPDWPELMELDPDLQFKHYTVAEAQLPAESLSRISHASLGDVEICCDLEHHVFNPGHEWGVRERAGVVILQCKRCGKEKRRWAEPEATLRGGVAN